MKRLAIVGASGMLGKSLVSALSDGYGLIGTYHHNTVPGFKQLNLTSPDEYITFLHAEKPDIVVHAAALTDLERCEHHPDEAKRLNVRPLEILADWAHRQRAQTVLISTDNVFDGARGQYREDDAPNPPNVYGLTKLQAEDFMTGVPGSLILRVAVLYSADIKTKKFLGNTIAKLKEGQTVNGTTDMIRSPTLTDDIAAATRELLRREAQGVYHVAGATHISMYDAARTVARVFGYPEKLVQPMLSTDIMVNGIPSIVKRAGDNSLDCNKLAAEGIRMRTLEEGLQYVKEHL